MTQKPLIRNLPDAGHKEAQLQDGDILFPGGYGATPYSNLADWASNTRSSGRVAGGVGSSHGDGTLDITQLDGWIFTTDSIAGVFIPFRMPAANVTGITDLATNWIYFDYNGGSPRYLATVTRSVIHEFDQFTVMRVYRRGNVVEILQSGHNIYNKDRRAHDRLILKYGNMDYVSGAQVTEPASLHVAVAAGSWYVGNFAYATAAMNSNTGGIFTTIYQSGVGAWTYTGGQTTVGTTQYNRTSDNTLQNLGNNRYGIWWVYVDPTGDVYLLMGQADYSKIADAQAATEIATRPPELMNWARLIAKIIFQKSATSFAEIDPYVGFGAVTGGASGVLHNQLPDLQGGVAGPPAEMYHLGASDQNLVVFKQLPVERVLTQNMTIPAGQSVVVAGPFETAGFVLEIAAGGVLGVI